MTDSILAALNLVRRLPPRDVVKTLAGLTTILPDDSEELLQRIDRPLIVLWDSKASKYFVGSDYNRDGDSYRSPWSNEYEPPLEEGPGHQPPPHLRQLEIQYNEVFDSYRETYYAGGVSSVSLWELPDNEGFACAFVVHKEVDDDPIMKPGVWDTVHVAEIVISLNQIYYKLTSTLMLNLQLADEALGHFDLSGSFTRQTEQQRKVGDISSGSDAVQNHILTLGRMVEDMEMQLALSFCDLHTAKTQQISESLRFLRPHDERRHEEDLASQFVAGSKSKEGQ